ncbi:MAG: esterase family protein [Mariniblastus sp.]|nr:esterase family protein [Mariniblastus sp.]
MTSLRPAGHPDQNQAGIRFWANRSVPSLLLTCFLCGTLPTNELLAQPGNQDSAQQEIEASPIKVFQLNSPNQAGPTEVHVLAPTRPVAAAKRRVLYLLPVEKLGGKKWGNALEEITQHDLHNRLGLICVYPTFSHLPWFADHPTDRGIQQETYLLQCVIPLVEKEYGIEPAAENRLLIGFSKSGYGAWSLLLRNPKQFAKAAAWDAPLMMQEPNRYGMGPIYGSQENFRDYQISELLKTAPGRLGSGPRLIHGGYANFQADHQTIDELVQDLKLESRFQNGPERAHSWNSGWLAPLLNELVKAEEEPSEKLP